METIKILLVEDASDQQEIFRSSVDVLNDKNQGQSEIQFTIASSLNDAVKKIDGTYDGTILDLKLNEEEDGGNKVVAELSEQLLRIPVIFVTGFPDLVDKKPTIVKIRARGDETYESDIKLLWDIKKTGLTNIMGGRGKIEETLGKVFLKNILPQIDNWIKYGKTESERTERALLRHTLNHLLQLLDQDDDIFYPEEVYIHPPLTESLKTGCILKKKVGEKYFVILNPACDLIIRKDGNFKTDYILLSEIENKNNVFECALKDITKHDKKMKMLKSIANNNYVEYYHWLPNTSFFEGGLLNFRNLCTLKKEELNDNFDKPKYQISPFFVKDIIARFSSFYARQGQPEIDYTDIISKMKIPVSIK